MIGKLSGCGSCGPGNAQEAQPSAYGIPGGYMTQFPPTGPQNMPDASMRWPTESLVPMAAPPSVVPIRDNTMPAITASYPTLPSSMITHSMQPPMEQAIPGAPTMKLLAGPQGFSGYGGYGAYGKKDSATKCEQFKAELIAAQSGQGKGILGIFGGQGIFGNRETIIQNKIEKWCGKAMSEAEAFAKADELYTQAVAVGDYATEAAVGGALQEQQAADATTQMYAAVGIGIAALGLVGVILATNKKDKRGRR